MHNVTRRTPEWPWLGALAALSLGMPLFIRGWLKFDLASRNWDNFRSAGATAGTADLLDPRRHAAWQSAHHFIAQVFPYPPAVAWFYKPVAWVSPAVGIGINAVIVVAACILAGLLAARIFSFERRFAILAIFAWQPAVDSMQTAENGAVMMLLAFAAIYGIARSRPAIAGLCIGALLLKPTLAVGFLLLLILRRQWRSLAIAAAVGAGWYLLSVGATGGNWTWPVQYANLIGGYYSADFTAYIRASMTLPAILMRLHVHSGAAVLSGAVLLAIAAPMLAATRNRLEAAGLAAVVGLAASPHAWGYDAALVLPALLYAIKTMADPGRTLIVALAYALALFQSILCITIAFNPLAIVVIGATLAWTLGAYFKMHFVRAQPAAA